MGLANGCIEGPNRSLTLGGAPTGSNGVAGGTLQLVQRLAATICVAAVTRWALNPVTAERSDITPLRIGVGLCAALLAGAAALSAVLSVQDRSAIRVDPSRHPTRVSRS
jgi:hypothetical protein